MKINRYFIFLILLSIGLLVLSSCKKDNDDNPLSHDGKGLTMKIDGKLWSALMTTLITQDHTGETEPYYAVSINGTVSVENGKEEDDFLAESLGLYINIPAGKFDNPKGKYDIIGLEDQNGVAWAMFSTSTDIRDAVSYSSLDTKNPGKKVGELEITGFETGEQTILGQPTGEVGYTKLSGNFHLELYPVDGSSPKLTVTEGKFNLSSGLGISFD